MQEVRSLLSQNAPLPQIHFLPSKLTQELISIKHTLQNKVHTITHIVSSADLDRSSALVIIANTN